MSRYMISKLVIGIVILMVAIIGCENPAGNDPQEADSSTDPIETVDPPENLVGTIALSDGTSAVLDISFSATSSSTQSEASMVRALAAYSIGGSVRYSGVTFAVSGTYDSETATLSATASNDTQGTFSLEGSYDETDGLSGTVTFAGTNSVSVAGSVNAVGVTDADRSTVSVFIGTYGGSAFGSWNGTLTTDRFYGTFAASDGSGDRGTFSATYVDGDVTSGLADDTSDIQVPFGGGLSENGDSIGGWYAGDAEEDGVTYPISGTWSGVKVDSSNDAPPVGASSGGPLVVNRFLQTLGNLFRRANDLAAEDEGTFSEEAGPTYFYTIQVGSPDVELKFQALYDGAPSVDSFIGWKNVTITLTGEGYSDEVTGITIGSGEVYAEDDTSLTTSSIREIASLIIDSNVLDDPENRDEGVTITFPDETTGVLYVNATINAENETVGGTWEYGPDDTSLTDVSGVVEGALF